MVAKKEDSTEEEKPKKKRGRPKGSKDKKPRTTKKKKAAAKKVKEEKPSLPDIGVPADKGPAAMKLAPDTDLGIEPDIRTMDQDTPEKKVEMPKKGLWHPSTSGDRDLSVPPDVLLRKKAPPSEVEDILVEPEEEERTPMREFVRPPVRTSLYRKLAVGFAIPVILLVLIVAYVTYAQATISIYPLRAEVRTERVVTVSGNPIGNDEVMGEVHEVTVGGEKTGFPSESVQADGVAEGFATVVNETSQPYTLVATTRLLTPEGVLFRLSDQITVPANGELKAEVYADEEGKSGDIGPSNFTIPGLREETQKVVYARSDEAMSGGVRGMGIASEPDISALEAELKAELEAEAKDELAKRIEGSWTGQGFEIDTMSRFVNVAPGEETDRIVVRLSLRVRSVSFDRVQALDVMVEDLKRGLTSDRELVSVNGGDAVIEVERADIGEKEGAVRVELVGESSVSLESPLFDTEKLKGMKLDDVQQYFDGIEGVDRIEVRFRPFWIKRMPDLADHIEFDFQK